MFNPLCVRLPLRLLVCSLAALSLMSSSASAQISKLGPTQPAIDGIADQRVTEVRGNDSAYDPVNRVYLVVGAYGPVRGVFVNESGVPVTPVFLLAPGAPYFAHYARAIYSPGVNGGAGGFLVTWHQDDGPVIPGTANRANQVHGRLVSYSANPTPGADVVLGGGAAPLGTFWEAAPAGAYSPTSQSFLVAWQTCCGGGSVVQYVRVDLAGNPVGLPTTLSIGYGRDPGVAYNPVTDEFGVSYSGEDVTSPTVNMARVRASDGATLSRTVVYRAAGSFITDITYNNALTTYLMVFYAAGVRSAEVSAAGTVLQTGLATSTVGTYDGLSVAYNPVSTTALLVGHSTSPGVFEVGGAELNGHGAKISTEQLVFAGGATFGSYYPRVSANKLLAHWDVTAAKDFAYTADQIIQTTSTDGGGGPPTDSDGDGVPDNVDQCPSVFAQTANGCPAVPPTDTDGDGVTDNVDQCPTTFAQTANGCPAPPPPPPGSCVSAPPGAGWSCVNGGWLPPGLLGITGDFTGDGKPDLIWENTAGQVYYWALNGTTPSGAQGFLSTALNTSDWQVVGTGDFNGDKQTDILWQQQSTGQGYIYFYNGTTKIGQQPLAMAPNTPWRIMAAGDFNYDGKTDIVFENFQTGQIAVWFMRFVNGVAETFGYTFMKTWDGQVATLGGGTTWRIVGTGDVNLDGHRDLIWQDDATGTLAAWFLYGSYIQSYVLVPSTAIEWKVRSVGDFNGDGKVDLIFHNSTTGETAVWLLNGVSILSPPAGIAGPVDLGWQVVGAK